jgi:hypothetical protein
MPTHVHFKPNLGANAIYLAQTAGQWPPGSAPKWVATVRPVAESLKNSLTSLGLDSEFAWLGLLNAASQFESNQELAATFLRRLLGATAQRTEVVSRFAGAITSLESSVRNAFPDLDKELALRVGPLREQWEARGPGILHRLATTTDVDLPPLEATVAIVSPIHGGGGIALLASNTVVFEGVLTNGDATLPEIVRLAWLVAQLQLDLPKFSEAIPQARLSQLAALALLPPILEAAHFVELIACPPDQMTPFLGKTIRNWMSTTPDPEIKADLLASWWETQVDSQVPWRVALAGLDRLI